MKLTIHGTRGSTPTPSRQMLKYGGNTSCFEISTENYQLFLDTGSGFSTAELHLESKQVICLYSHFHHDHIQGLPFNRRLFPPAAMPPGRQVITSSGLVGKDRLRQTLRQYFSGRHFPLDIIGRARQLRFLDFAETAAMLEPEIRLERIGLNHPGGATGYSITGAAGKIVSLMDNEWQDCQLAALSGFCDGADIVIWDGQFTAGELAGRKGWGHSSMEQAVLLAEPAAVGTMLICHHAPWRTDSTLDRLAARLGNAGSTAANLLFGREGMCLPLR